MNRLLVDARGVCIPDRRAAFWLHREIIVFYRTLRSVHVDARESGRGPTFLLSIDFARSIMERHQGYPFRCLIIFALACAAWSGVAEGQIRIQARIDSLEGMLRTARREDRNRVKLLNTASEAWLRRDAIRAREYAEAARVLAKRLSYPVGLGYALLNLGNARYNIGYIDSAKRSFEESLDIFKNARCKECIGSASNAIGRALVEHGRADLALEYYGKALSIARELRSPLAEASVLHNMGTIHSGRRKFVEAMDLFRSSLAIRERARDSGGIAFSYYAIAMLHDRMGRDDSAMEYLRRCLDIRQRLGDDRGSGYASHMMGNILIMNGEYAEAIRSLERALKFKEDTRDETGVAAVSNSLGVAMTSTGEYQDAIRHLLRALDIQERFADTGAIADVVTNIGNVYISMDEYSNALIYYNRAVALRESIHDENGLYKALNNIGVIHYYRAEYDEALILYDCVLAFRRERQEREWIPSVLDNIGLVYAGQKRYDDAIRYHMESLAQYHDLGNPLGEAATLINIGKAEHACGRDDAAFESASQGFALAIRLGDADFIRSGYEALTEIATARGDFRTAFTLQREFTAFRDSLVTESSARVTKELTAKYENEKKERRIAEFEKNARLRLLELDRSKKALLLKQLEAERNRQHADSLERVNLLQKMDLSSKAKDLEIQTQKIRSERAAKEYQSSLAAGEAKVKNVLFIALGLLLAIGFLVVKRIQDKRTEATLMAEAARLRAAAAESESLRVLADAERKEKEAQRAFSRRLITSQEQERKRIAVELHDGISQDILVMQNRAAVALRRGEMDDETRRQLGEIERTASVTMEDVRKVSRNLRPTLLERAGLTETLRSVLSSIDETSDIRFSIHIADVDGAFRPEDDINVFRLVQESVNNIIRHSNAMEAAVRLERRDADVILRISDDGRGFGVHPDKGGREADGMGLKGMEERIRMMNGEWRISSGTGKGTSIVIRLPSLRDVSDEAARV